MSTIKVESAPATMEHGLTVNTTVPAKPTTELLTAYVFEFFSPPPLNSLRVSSLHSKVESSLISVVVGSFLTSHLYFNRVLLCQALLISVVVGEKFQ